MNHVVGGIASSAPNGDSFSPKDKMENLSPLILSTTAGLHDRFANVKVLRLDNAVRPRVVAGDTNVVNAILFTKDIESSNVGGSVVGNELSESAPTAENILEDEIGDNSGGVRRRSATLRIGSQSTLSMKDVTIRPNSRHKEGVDMSLAEQRGNFGDNRRDVEVFGLANLALMTHPGVPANVVVEVRPPEANEEIPGCGEDTLVSKIVVRVGNESETIRGRGN